VAERAEPVERDLFALPWNTLVFVAAILANGPIKVPAKAMQAAQRNEMHFALYQEWDEETQTMTYTVPEHG
jgi:hypothetical protein